MHAGNTRKGCFKIRVLFFLAYVVLLCVLLLLPTTSVLKRKEIHTTVSFFSVSATPAAVSFASVLLLLLLVRRDMHFLSLFEVLLLLIIFLVGCAAAAGAAGACAAYNISTEAERGTGYCSSFYVSVPDTAMLGTSVDAVVLGCFLFCLLDCDNPIMVVDCAAVETGCMLETQVKVASK